MTRFGLVKGAKKWRVIECVSTQVQGGVRVPEFRYATDPLTTKTAALAAFVKLATAAPARVINPLDD